MPGWLIIFIVMTVSCLLTSCYSLSREHDEARNVEIRNIDFMKLVDVISGATLTSKAFLKSIDNALFKAEQ